MCAFCNPQVAFTPPTTDCSRLFHLIEVSLAAAKNFRSIIFTSSQALLPNWDLFCPKHIRRVPHRANSPAPCLWSSPPLSQRCEPTVHFDPNFKFLHLATVWPHKWCWNATNASQSVSEEAKSVNYMLRSCSQNCFWPVFLQVLDFFFSNPFFGKGSTCAIHLYLRVVFVSIFIIVSIFVYLYLTAVMAVGRGGPNWCAHTALQLARQGPLKVKVEGGPSTRYIYIQKSASILYVEGVEVDNYLHNPKPILWFRGGSVAGTFSKQIWRLRRFFYCKKGQPPPPPPSPKQPEPQISLNLNIFKNVIIYISPIMK